jgi:tetratricopeptide (TPR) repeat protein
MLQLQPISETTANERERRREAGALVLRTVEQVFRHAEGWEFVAVRAEREVAALSSSAEKAMLGRLLRRLEEAAPAAGLADVLVAYAYELEKARRLPEADSALALARVLAPREAAIALHAGRVTRRLGQPDRALRFYRVARTLDRSGGTIARLAAVGEAVVSVEPERELARAVRTAVRAGDREAAAVALEERARVRRAAGRPRAAARDLGVAALRYADAVDRARVAHELADLMLVLGDAPATREALLAALQLGDGSQRDHARGRLHTLCRDTGDQIGMRRWRSASRPALTSLSLRPRRSAATTAAPWLARWRERVEPRPAVVGC